MISFVFGLSVVLDIKPSDELNAVVKAGGILPKKDKIHVGIGYIDKKQFKNKKEAETLKEEINKHLQKDIKNITFEMGEVEGWFGRSFSALKAKNKEVFEALNKKLHEFLKKKNYHMKEKYVPHITLERKKVTREQLDAMNKKIGELSNKHIAIKDEGLVIHNKV